MKPDFRQELITFLKQASEKSENYYGYINPYFICEIVSALMSTKVDNEPELEELMDWANEYWSR